MSVRAPVKKAVLVGVCSQVAKDLKKLPGALEDVKKLGNLLIDTYQYTKDDITIVVNTEVKEGLPDSHGLPTNLPLKLPTEDDILEAMTTLVANAKCGDHIFFGFAGHGAQADAKTDKNEIDGKDEGLLASDSRDSDSGTCPSYSHFIRDDKIREIFVDKLQEGVHCTVRQLLFDCCHSGTACDLPEVQLPSIDSANGEVSGAGEDKGSPPTKPGAPGFSLAETVNHGHAASHRESASNDQVSTKDVAFVEILKGTPPKEIKHKDLLLELRRKLEEVTEAANKRNASSKNWTPCKAPEPQLGSLTPGSILGKDFTL
uniref:Metacaspase-1 (EC) n=1 Tax=Ganoderma boninense TaxID=34458 RepID=A0A5K1JYW7_9APHY|nr:Metacaspase-1 (EC [Ganoderma boninense]